MNPLNLTLKLFLFIFGCGGSSAHTKSIVDSIVFIDLPLNTSVGYHYAFNPLPSNGDEYPGIPEQSFLFPVASWSAICAL